ncbi:tetratricopeptide repeat protein [Nonlabens sp.]|uniref:tetratricopeptide repeat protein n=1 Tax=Nonlabens sp. TaxID=1888209 RepID=UPI001BCC833B|nr:tetratricopeptide repeat protein [Nonlabens sp.]
MTEALYERAYLLYQQRRYSQSEDILNQALTQDPNDISCLHLLAEVNLAQGDPKKAKHFIDIAIGLAPSMAQLYATKAKIMLDVERYDEAEELLKEAISLNAQEPQNYAMLAHVSLSRKRYKDAEQLAEKALSLDPANLLALNVKSTSQLKQNKRAASEETLKGALGENPEDSYTHTNYGWNKLEMGDHKAALEHFKEALKYDPNNSYAQAGMMQALQARYFVYRWFLKYQFWLGNMGAKYQWFFIIGFYLGTRAISYAAETVPALEPFLTPVVVLLALIALSTWVIGPVSQLLFSFNKYAKFLLSKKEKQAVIFTAVCILISFSGVAGYLLLDDFRFLMLAIAGLILMIPWSMFYMETKPALMMPLAAGIMTLIAGIALYISFTTEDVMNVFVTAFLISFFAFQWFANAVSIKRSNI